MGDAAGSSEAGPFVTALLSVILPTGLAGALVAHMPVTVLTTMAVIIPVMTFATMCVAVSMAWAFVIAAKHRRVRQLPGMIASIIVSMLLMLGLTVVLLRYSMPLV